MATTETGAEPTDGRSGTLASAFELVVTIRGGADIGSQLADACERYGWQLPLSPFIPDVSARATLAVLQRAAANEGRVCNLHTSGL